MDAYDRFIAELMAKRSVSWRALWFGMSCCSFGLLLRWLLA